MCFFNAEDLTGECSCIAFPSVFLTRGSLVHPDTVLCLSGHISRKDNAVTLICDEIAGEHEFEGFLQTKRLCCKVADSDTETMQKIVEVCKRWQGETPVCLFLMNTRRYLLPKLRGIEICTAFYEALTAVILPSSCALIDRKT